MALTGPSHGWPPSSAQLPAPALPREAPPHSRALSRGQRTGRSSCHTLALGGRMDREDSQLVGSPRVSVLASSPHLAPFSFQATGTEHQDPLGEGRGSMWKIW